MANPVPVDIPCAYRRLRGFVCTRILAFFVAINFWVFGSAVFASAALTVATYNVENYLVADRMVDGVYRDAYPKPENEKTALRQVIKAMAPDILALQEMGTQPFLDELLRDLKKDGVDYPYVTLLDGPDPDRHVAVLSKVPFNDVHPHAKVPVLVMGKKDNVKRGVLEVSFATTEGELTLFVIHLKSRRTEQKEDVEGVKRRQEEAEAVRDLILKRFPDPKKGRFILCGDWNDTRSSKPVKSLQKRGETVLGEILRAADSRGEVWTHAYYKEDSYSRIDYFLLSADLQPLVRGGRGKVYDGPGVADASDHRPVVLTLNLDAVK
jgi:endonuclease/exonuclease/phosphatase family metal-dependent hydrolase